MSCQYSRLFCFNQELNNLPNQVAGDWWVVKGQNCGQDGWPGGYDWYPCQGHLNSNNHAQAESFHLNDIFRFSTSSLLFAPLWVDYHLNCQFHSSITVISSSMTGPGSTISHFAPGQIPSAPLQSLWTRPRLPCGRPASSDKTFPCSPGFALHAAQ